MTGEDYDGRFARAAIVADKRWLVAVTGVVDRLMSQAEMRTFAPAERLIALARATELYPSLG
ncbi:MAG: STAS/SEC14 domain-containing protein [Proteobacteria bacterium]|nr:STAS/SEC14 domain-containing protein [Pseudomonadota bacterium]